MRTLDKYATVVSAEYNGVIHNISMIAYTPDFSKYKDYYEIFKITSEYEYRPDKIANKLWANQRAAWILNAINGFTHGMKEYESGKSIFYLNADILTLMGVF
jgi:hypothetical protein